MVCFPYGIAVDMRELKQWSVTNCVDRKPYSAYSQLKQDLDFSDFCSASTHLLELRFSQPWHANGIKNWAERQWNRCMRCNFSRNGFNFQSCLQEKQSIILRLSISGLILGEPIHISRACNCVKKCQAGRKSKVLIPQAINQSYPKEDDLLDIALQEDSLNLAQTTGDEFGISRASVIQHALSNHSDLTHKELQNDYVGEIVRESRRKRRVFQDKNGRNEVEQYAKTNKSHGFYGALVSANNDEEIQNVLKTMGAEYCHKYWNIVLKSLEIEDQEKSLKLFNWMRQKGKAKGNLPAYNIAFRLLSMRGDWNTVENLLQEIRGDSSCKLNCQIFNTLIYACSKKGLAQCGTKWFHQMIEEGIKPTEATYGMLMSLYQKVGNLREAEITFEHVIKSATPCSKAYSAMITIYTRSGLYEKAEEVVDLMNKNQVPLNRESWLVQINTYSQQGKLQTAEKVIQLMQKEGMPPNIIAYNSLIKGYGKAGLLKRALNLFQDLQNVGLKPDEATYRSMIEGCGRAGKLHEALWYYNEMKRNGFHPNSLNLKTIINLLAKFKNEEEAVHILSDMREMGCEYSSIIQTLVQAYERADVLYKVPSILKSCFHGRRQLGETASAILVLAYVRNGMLTDALCLLEETPGKGTSFSEALYHVVICSCKEAGNYDGAVRVFSKMPKVDANPNLQITCTMIDIYSRMGLFGKAQDLFLQLKASNIVLDMVTYSVVLKMYLKEDMAENALQVLEMMENQNDIEPDSCLFHYILRVYHKCNMPDKAAEVYYRILRAGLKWDGAMYNCIINCCGRALPIDETSKVYDDMLKSSFLPNTITLNVMIDIYGKAGLLTKAYEVLRFARKQGLSDIVSYNTMLSAYGKWKDYERMEEILEEILRSGLAVSLEAYNSMLDAYGKSGQLKEFGEVLEQMSRAECNFDLFTYNILINVYGKNGMLEEITNILSKLKEEGLQPDAWTYNTLIGAYGVLEMPDDAVRVVNEMLSAGIQPDRITYVNLIAAFEKSDNFLEAARWSIMLKQYGIAR
ncbi:hypothetical protein SUGI_0544430 [Cryptomeria japonica]|uniref:pentatricopeptide repeat-containing protein At4g30825, chloroplastic n=1 Tax=Cryptomeria japonica TaxID=3369 RepID=UPI0024089E0A|nr:pentatricopeptide repeat-containing protein At4g30825, chloroplastic [Cryptomeria japonica]GLJ27739.1 hypothetical protein SUGI_0544430 [Cryptomeria japonica]